MKSVSYDTKPTVAQFAALQTAYTHFNETLFNNRLPECIITLARKRNAKGYHWANAYTHRNNTDQLDEIALNPACFDRPDAEILSTLVHEMVHLWQHYNGKETRNGYHNKQWAQKMLDIGLQPTHDGTPNGKQTGQRITHIIVPNGAYASAVKQLDDVMINWRSHDFPTKQTQKNKITYICNGCDLKVWGKPNIVIICGNCELLLEAQI
jgi:predicted SprT family Zn-dependent metalloprotease